MDITAKIHKHRIDKGWSVAKLARESKIPTVSLRVMLSREDSNSFNITPLSRIAESLGVSVSYLTRVEGEDSKPHITEGQKRELLELINETINTYFQIQK